MRKFLDELKDFFKKGDMTLLILALIVAGFGCVCMTSATMADKIVVIDGGVVTEVGSHAELMAEKGTYYRLYTGAFELE